MAPVEKQVTPKKSDDQKPMGSFRMLGLWLLLLVLFLLMFNLFNNGKDRPESIRYNPDFIQMVEQGKIQECTIVSEVAGGQHIIGELKEIDTATNKPKQFKVDLVVTDHLPLWLEENGVRFSFRRQTMDIWGMLRSALPALLVLGLLYFLFVRQIRSVGQGAMGFGKSRAKLLNRDTNKVTFEQVAGVDEAQEEVHEIVEFLKDPKKFQSLGGRMPKGVLLTGPPGTGKTLLAKAIAGEAGVPFFSISGSDFVEMFVGVGASRVRDMFEQAKKSAPCIVFIDEIDAVGRSRFSGIGGGHDEREQTLNALLVEMDGFETQDGVIIIAATNRPDVLDNALLRPGRFDRQIVIDLPILQGREAILKIHAKNITLDKNADLRRLARGTPGFSGADLANLLNEAALLASRQGKEAVGLADLEEARDKVRWGRERRSHVLDDEEKRLTAFHESGHAMVMAKVEKSEPIHKLTIIPRGMYLGATMQLPEKDRSTESYTKLKGTLASLMGGRAAEELMAGDISTGAANDFKQATRLARLMVCDWGMSSEMGPQSFGNHEDMMFLGREITRSQDFSEDTARRIDFEVSKLLREAYEQAMKILEENRGKLEMIAKLLIERETLDGRDVEDIAKHGRVLSDEERAIEDKDKADDSSSATGDNPEDDTAVKPEQVETLPAEARDKSATEE